MTDEQIEKALEVCTKVEGVCIGCPYFDVSEYLDCANALRTDALALIRRQKKQLFEQMLTVDEHCDKCIAEIRAEAIREFADKVTALVTQRYYFVQSLLAAGEEDEPYYGGKSEAYMQANIYVAEVLKEMTEEQK
jgi:predicted aconitase